MAIQIKRVDPASVDPAPAGLLKLYGNDTTGAIEFVDEDGTVLVVTSAVLGLLAALTPAADKLPYFSGPSSAALTTLTSFVRTLLDDPDAATALATLGAAPLASPAFTGNPTAPNQTLGDNSTKLANTAFVAAAIAALINSAPGALDTLKELADALADDASFAATITTALALKAPLASPALSGTPTAPNPSTSDDSTAIATTHFVQQLITALTTGVASIFGRTGAVTAQTGDYSVGQVTGAAPAASPTFTGTVTVPDPSSATDAANKKYVDNKVAGLSWKQAVRAKTTAALAANTYNNGTGGVGATLTGNSNGALAAQDGITLVADDRILVDQEASGSHNGIYVVTQVGDGAHPYILTRATDADEPAEIVNAALYVSEGTTYADKQFVCTTNASITVGTTSVTFVQLSTGSSGPSRADVSVTTGSLANGSTENGTVTLSKWGHIGPIAADRDCWIRLYATSADRTADAGRTLGTPAAATTNLLGEWSFASGVIGSNAQTLRRLGVDYFNGDATPTSTIYYAIVNRSQATSTVQVTFTHLPLEI